MSMFKKGLSVAGLGLAAGLMSGGQADALSNDANSATADVDVSANVVSACEFDNDGILDFGDVDNSVGGTAQISVQITCNSTNTFQLIVDDGDHFTNGVRHMDNGVLPTGDQIPYHLCSQDMSVSGNSCDDANTFDFTATTAGTAEQVPIYGWVAPSEIVGNVAPGVYTDQLLLSVSF